MALNTWYFTHCPFKVTYLTLHKRHWLLTYRQMTLTQFWLLVTNGTRTSVYSGQVLRKSQQTVSWLEYYSFLEETLQEVTPEQHQSMKPWATDHAAVIDALGVRMGAVQPQKNNWIKSNWAIVLIIWWFLGSMCCKRSYCPFFTPSTDIWKWVPALLCLIAPLPQLHESSVAMAATFIFYLICISAAEVTNVLHLAFICLLVFVVQKKIL